MSHKLILIIAILDLFILLVTACGLVFTIYKIKKKKFNLINRDYGLLGMYFTFLLFSGFSFIVEWSLIFHIHDTIPQSVYNIHDTIPQSVYNWIVVKRIVHAIFTGLAIAWSSGYRFGGTQPSGI